MWGKDRTAVLGVLCGAGSPLCGDAAEGELRFDGRILVLVGQRQNCRSGCGDTAEGELRSPIGALKPWPCPSPSRHCAMLECEGRAQITHSSRHNAAPAPPSRSCLCARARALDLQEVFGVF